MTDRPDEPVSDRVDAPLYVSHRRANLLSGLLLGPEDTERIRAAGSVRAEVLHEFGCQLGEALRAVTPALDALITSCRRAGRAGHRLADLLAGRPTRRQRRAERRRLHRVVRDQEELRRGREHDPSARIRRWRSRVPKCPAARRHRYDYRQRIRNRARRR